MKQINNKLGLFLLLSIFVQFLNGLQITNKSYSNSLLEVNLITKCNINKKLVKEFTKNLVNIKKTSTKQSCIETNCRGWMEQSLISLCKADEFRAKAELQEIKPLYVYFKGHSVNEYTQYIYIFNLEKEKNDKNLIEGVQGALLFRVCVSIDRGKKSYVDYRCPLSPCTDFKFVGDCQNHTINMSIISADSNHNTKPELI